jgi:hypothetical protein
MTKLAALLLLALAGCHGKSDKTLDPNTARAIKDRAQAAHDDAGGKKKDGLPDRPKDLPKPKPLEEKKTLVIAPDAPPSKTAVLGKDSRGCTWVESEATVVVGENESNHQARAAAIAEAEQTAMRDFLGVHVRSRFLDFQHESLKNQANLTESILQTTRQGRVMDEKILEKGRKDLPSCEGCNYYVKLQVCLAPLTEDADKDFRVELKLSRLRFEEGDEAKISVTTTRDAYIYLYDVGMDWETSMIAPNEHVKQIKLDAGQTFEYPNDEARRNGVKLIAMLPESRPPVSAETIRVIASKVPLTAKMMELNGGSFMEIYRRLAGSKSDWTEDAQAFTIYPK